MSEQINIDKIAFEIIWHAGNAKSLCMEAISASNANDNESAETNLKKASEELKEAHKIQTKLLQECSNGEMLSADILMAHAQDHLTMGLMSMDFAKQIILMNKKILALENELSEKQ
jgi:PTS system cellobiose-specific IIA component